MHVCFLYVVIFIYVFCTINIKFKKKKNNNLDHKHTNNSDKLLLNFCKENKIRILNGQTIGDLNRLHTYI